MSNCRLTVICLTIALLADLAPADGQTVPGTPIEPFLVENCFDCHTGENPEAGLNLQHVSVDLADGEVRRRWVDLYDRVAKGEMPPKSESGPDPEAKSKFLRTLGGSLTLADLANRETILRRLNRNEYENTVRDLFGIYVDVKRLLPDDSAEQGFDNTGSALSLSAEQMVRYIEAADIVLDRVFGSAKKPNTISRTGNFATARRGTDSSERKLSDGVVLFSGAKFLPLYDMSLPGTGLYRVRMKIRAEQSESPVVMHVLGGNTGAIAPHTVGFFEALPGKVTTVEFTDRNPERSDCFAFGIVGGFPWWKVNEQEYKGAGLFIGDIEIEGPIEPWPPPSRIKLLGDVDPEKGTLGDIRSILSRQLPHAFRRATDVAEVEPYVALAKQALDEGLSFEKALRRGLKGIICAPEFLFLEERYVGNALGESLPDPERPAHVTIDDFALASRLSYFLWSSVPDQELHAMAQRGELRKPDLLRAQVERMLADSKSKRFVESFTGQWLRLYDIDFTVPDHNLYPEYDQLLRRSMLDETHAFFRELLDRDHSVQNFIDSEFVMVNQPLADFYGINGVEGLKIRRIKLPPDSLRGGILTQASVLKVSADGTRTSPVLRGAWILKHLYGTPSPPPPPTIEAIEPDIRGATTIREQLAKHREHESCNRCHRKIDPPGFALESFDVIGAERDWYRTRGSGKYVKVPRHPQAPRHFVQYRQGPDVDASGTMPDGRTFADIREYKQLLLEDEKALPISLARLLLSYSLGRHVGFSDRSEVDRIVGQAQKANYGLRSLVHEIVQSDVFKQP
ncbi:MAG: DUF1592 domain-containing protein [Planctomycetes bacterium]|nr:DUF1592 domain-containing protein [Planctomycetota bacterium]